MRRTYACRLVCFLAALFLCQGACAQSRTEKADPALWLERFHTIASELGIEAQNIIAENELIENSDTWDILSQYYSGVLVTLMGKDPNGVEMIQISLQPQYNWDDKTAEDGLWSFMFCSVSAVLSMGDTYDQSMIEDCFDTVRMSISQCISGDGTEEKVSAPFTFEDRIGMFAFYSSGESLYFFIPVQ